MPALIINVNHSKRYFCDAKVQEKREKNMSETKMKEIVQVNAIIDRSDIDDDVTIVENGNMPKSENNVYRSKHADSNQSLQTFDTSPNIIVAQSDDSPSNSTDERRQSITNSSIDSNKVSIKSIIEYDDSSNSSDLDSDFENVIYNNQNDNISINRTDILVQPNRIIDPNKITNSNILCAKDATERPNIGSIAMQNCNDVTFGDKTYISGNVIVKQFIHTDDQNTWKERAGFDNSAYTGGDNDFNQNQNGSIQSNDHPDEMERKWKWTSKQALTITLVAGICLFVLTLIIIILKVSSGPDTTSKPPNKIGDGEDSRLNIPIPSTIGSDIMFPSNSDIRFVSRDEWIAQPPSSEITDLELPAKRVIIAHTATENCSAQAECTFRVRFIQTYHIESRGWSDIGYNFLVGGDGSIYEGRGWKKQGAHTRGFNQKSICFAFIGTFNTVLPPPHQIEAAKKMIAAGVQLGMLDKNYKLYGHRQLAPFESPGARLFLEMKKWDHWSEVVVDP